ncbi:hypothetical protein MES4922_400012 [Mesorhizobium ventifaucium]|uniref:Uncharacterized protein n=2 Tax=Mesorhizobium TaxID=68287 RepID=A0ABN8K8I2_9HYPH|nr:hypothetical protein MES5069_100031 [Mesorhizobium escarrei]CAH2405852.1 hypothetical protein MES4922_400012 [Mesorhizobium ventifaucium]
MRCQATCLTPDVPRRSRPDPSGPVVYEKLACLDQAHLSAFLPTPWYRITDDVYRIADVG